MSDLSPKTFILCLVDPNSGKRVSWTHDMPNQTVARRWIRTKQLIHGPTMIAEIRNDKDELIAQRRPGAGDWERAS